MGDTWAQRDLEKYLKDYATGSETTERRKRVCALCGCGYDLADCKALPVFPNSGILIDGKKPDSLIICNSCYKCAESITDESEEL